MRKAFNVLFAAVMFLRRRDSQSAFFLWLEVMHDLDATDLAETRNCCEALLRRQELRRSQQGGAQ